MCTYYKFFFAFFNFCLWNFKIVISFLLVQEDEVINHLTSITDSKASSDIASTTFRIGVIKYRKMTWGQREFRNQMKMTSEWNETGFDKFCFHKIESDACKLTAATILSIIHKVGKTLRPAEFWWASQI